ncbi:MAG: thioredoxin family protein [Betaproteobacteria bacterium]|nr:thioredoxin family protein [Betaproteobacteria bacterium]
MPLRKLLSRVLVVAILALVATAPFAQNQHELPYADDFTALAKQVRERGAPIMIAFTQADCPYCWIARRDHLAPMHLSADLRDRVILREIDVDSHRKLRDFEGRTVTQREFSRRYQVERVPTVVVVDSDGKLLAPPIVGLFADDFYRLYLQQAIEAGLYKLRTRTGK